MQEPMTAGELRKLLAGVPADDPVMLVIDERAAWLQLAEHDPGARTVDLRNGPKPQD